MDTFLTEALLQNVMLQDVWLAARTDAPLGGGAGTWDDPFLAANPNLSDSQNADLFDGIMSDAAKVRAGTAVHLGPGTFFTRGHSTGATGAWSPRDRMRLIGSGMDATTLKLTGVSTGQTWVAIGVDATDGTHGLHGFEASDFTIDCGFSAAVANSANLAVGIYGRDIWLQRLRVTQFGGNVSGAILHAIGAAGLNSENCVVRDCRAENPATNAGTQSTLVFFGLGGSETKPHRFCVIRNCVGRGTGDWDSSALPAYQHGIAPGAGLGTIIEGNEIANAASGVYDDPAKGPAKDLVIWKNNFRNVGQGIAFNRTSGATGRIVATYNQVAVRRSLSNPAGIYLGGTGTGRYKTLVLRNNTIRDIAPDAQNPILGVRVSGCEDLNAERNVIDNSSPTESVRHENCDAVKFFRNETSAGVLLRGYNGSAYTLELEDQVQDMLLASGSEAVIA